MTKPSEEDDLKKNLEAQWIGPYTIIKKINDVNYVIKGGRKTLRVHANRIKSFID